MVRSLPPAPPSPPPSSPRRLLTEIGRIGQAPPLRWAFALRAALAMGVPVLCGWLAGDLPAGMMATIGGFTALYAGSRPYPSRGLVLAAIAVALAAAVILGLWLERLPWLVVPALALVAMTATWLGNACRLGPPGAYLFVLACAAGTAMPAQHLSAWHAGLLVLAGGGFAWLLHMAGALLWPRGPERSAVVRAGRAVIACIDALASPDADSARRTAAQALHESWQTLVGFQPIPARPRGELARLRGLNRDLHLLFAATIDATPDATTLAQWRAQAGALIAAATQPPVQRPPDLPASAIPHGYPHSWTRLREGLAWGSNALRTVLRVGLATLLAGVLAGLLDLHRAYWAIAAALLMLHQGLDWPRTLQRSLERTLGTWVGLLLAGAILWLHPDGLWLVVTIMALQFAIEIAVVRNYAIAVVFITGIALTIASGGHAVDDLGGLLLERGVDTLLGCACALLAFRWLPPRNDARTLSAGIGHCLLAIRQACLMLADGDVTRPPARQARRDLQHRCFQLAQAVDDAVAGSAGERRDAATWWPAVATCQRLAYRVLAACWDAERDPAGMPGPSRARPDPGDIAGAAGPLRTLALAWLQLRPPPALPTLPELLREDIGDLHAFLAERTR